MDFGKRIKNILVSSKIGKSNFKSLDDLIHSGVKNIVLESDYVIDDNEITEYEDGIELDVDGLVIDGNGHSIDAREKTRIFLCKGSITIKNITLKNGHSPEGGAIYNTDELTLICSTIKDNSSNFKGGAIINSSNMNISNCTFSNNKSSDGGAIFNMKNLEICNSKLTNNNAHVAGAINNDGGNLTITKSTIQTNHAGNGGAILNLRGAELKIIKSTLKGNDANNGGAISNGDNRIPGNVTIIKSELTDNTGKSGGAIYVNKKGKVNISKSNISRNTAQSGGAIYSWDGILSIENCVLSKNTADIAGAIYKCHNNIIVSESEIKNNVANKNAGAIYNGEGSFKIFDCEISKNTSPDTIINNNDYLKIEGTIFNDNHSLKIIFNEGNMTNLSIFSGEFSENKIEGAVIDNNAKSCTIEKTVFENNFANSNSKNMINSFRMKLISPKINDDGKSILNNGKLILKNSDNIKDKIEGSGKVTVKGVIPLDPKFDFGYLDKMIHENTTKEIVLKENICFEDYESDFYEGGIELDIDNLIIDGNGKTIDGGYESRIFLITGSNITLKNIIFKNGFSHRNYDNPFNNNGGSIKNNHNNKLTIENCEFIDNTSEDYGGAIINYGEIDVMDSIFTGNKANVDGGAVNNSNKLSIAYSTLTNNMANKNGAAINNEKGCDATIIQSYFTDNTTKKESSLTPQNGGAINNRGNMNINDSTLTDNVSNANGGAIRNEGDLTIDESTISYNTAYQNGGAIFNAENGFMNMANSTLSDNTAGCEGGALCNVDGEFFISKSDFKNNEAKRFGAISSAYSTSTIEDCKFKDNVPDDVQ